MCSQLSRPGSHRHHRHVTEVTVGDKDFRAIHHIVITLKGGSGLDALQIGTGTRLGHGHGSDRFTGGHFGQPLAFLFMGAKVVDVVGNNVRMQRKAAGRITHPGLLFHKNHRVEAVNAAATVFLGHGGTQQPKLTRLVPQLAIEMLLLFPLLVIRGNFRLEETSSGGAKRFMVFIEQGTGNHWRHIRRYMHVTHYRFSTVDS